MKQTRKPILTLITTVLGGLATVQGSPVVAATQSATGPSRDEMVITARKKEELFTVLPEDMHCCDFTSHHESPASA